MDNRVPRRFVLYRQRVQGTVLDALDDFIAQAEERDGVDYWTDNDPAKIVEAFGAFLQVWPGYAPHCYRGNDEDADAKDDAAIEEMARQIEEQEGTPEAHSHKIVKH